jgi:hypothetical protein
MARIAKAQRALDRAHQHRATLERLLTDRAHLRSWFIDWAESELRRDRFYIYSDAEHAVLADELARMRPLSGLGGYSIIELHSAAMKYLADCNLEDEDFLKKLDAERPVELPLWQLTWLVAICTHIAGLPLPPLSEFEAA